MRKKQIIIIVSLFLVLGLPVASIACEETIQNGSRGRQRSLAGCIIGQKDDLGLADEQISQLEFLKSKADKQQIQDEALIKVLRIELFDLSRQDKVDLTAINAKIEEIGDLYTRMQKDYIYARLDAEKILTAEQLKKLREHQARRRSREEK